MRALGSWLIIFVSTRHFLLCFYCCCWCKQSGQSASIFAALITLHAGKAAKHRIVWAASVCVSVYRLTRRKKTRWNSTGFCRRLYLRLLWPLPLNLWPQNLISTSENQYSSVTKIGWNSLDCFFLRYGVHKVFGTHRLTHSLTDGQTQTQYASGTIFQRWRMHKIIYFFDVTW